MRVLVFNAGSASLKFDLVEVAQTDSSPSAGRKVVSAIIEGIGGDPTSLSLLEGKDVTRKIPFKADNYSGATTGAIDWLRNTQSGSESRVDLVGHRVVHGAGQFDKPALIDAGVIEAIRALDKLAPLHNQAAIEVIESSRKVLGESQRMVAVFDTAFHRTLPPAAFTYALPHELIEKHRIRRYGFHGLSHRYLMMRYCELTERSPKGHKPLDAAPNKSETAADLAASSESVVRGSLEDVRLLTTHLESGASICAIDHGQSVETSMGFTPLEGLVMGKRSGDLDPAIVPFLAREENLSVEEVEKVLNTRSGMFGLSGISHDTRDLMKHVETNEQVRLTLDVFCHRLRKYIGAYLAVLNGADALVFGGGIGEDSPWLRERICRDLDWLGISFSSAANEPLVNREGCISKADSRVQVWVIPTEEALMLAWEAARLS